MPESANNKATVRSRFVNDRLTLGNHLLRKASSELTERLLQASELRVYAPGDVPTVCAYASFGTEPDTTELVDNLRAQGARILLPVLLPDGDLDWAVDSGRFSPGRFGLREPVGDRLGVEAIRDADVVLVPALAVSSTGYRLGRGGGSYDRALARLTQRNSGATQTFAQSGQSEQSTPPAHPHRPWTCALVYDNELEADFPVDPHDQPVDAACTPSRLVRFDTATRRHNNL